MSEAVSYMTRAPRRWGMGTKTAFVPALKLQTRI